MTWTELAPYLIGGGATSAVPLALLARRFFVNWSKENVAVQGADATAAMMANFHTEISRLSKANDSFSKENAELKKQVSRLEAMLEKLCVKFDVSLDEIE
jgi:hypothetical protein